MGDTSNWDVIIVDDEPHNIGVIKLVFDFNNIPVRTAESGQECLTMMKKRMPTQLLVDIQMPGMSGYDLLSIIRANDDWKHLPIIAVTAHAMENDEARIIEAGFDGYIAKPVDVMTLINDIETIVEACKTKNG